MAKALPKIPLTKPTAIKPTQFKGGLQAYIKSSKLVKPIVKATPVTGWK